MGCPDGGCVFRGSGWDRERVWVDAGLIIQHKYEALAIWLRNRLSLPPPYVLHYDGGMGHGGGMKMIRK